MAFADAEKVAARMGVDSFEGAELAQVEALLDAVGDLILDAVDKTSDWASDASTSVPAAFQRVSVEAVARVLNNPTGARSTSETVGKHSFSQSFRDAASALELTDAEEARLRRAVYGRRSGSARPRSLLDDLLCGDVAGS